MLTRFTLLLFTGLLGCAGGGSGPSVPPPPPPPPPPGTVRILMLGNSLTYTQDVPGLVADFATAGGVPRPVVASIAHANWGLQDHAGSAPSTSAVASGGYDVVVLQQGPSTLPASRDDMLAYAGILHDLAPSSTRMGLFVAWPPEGGDIDAGIANHTTVANQLSLALYPVAQAFREAKRIDPTIPIYSADEFHQSATGSALAGMVIAAVIFNQDPTGYPNPFHGIITDDDLMTIRAAAKFAVDTYGRR